MPNFNQDGIFYTAVFGIQILYPIVILSCMESKKNNYLLRIISCIIFSVGMIFLAAAFGYSYRFTWWLTVIIHVMSIFIIKICNDCDWKLVFYLKIWSMAFYYLLLQLQGFVATIINADRFYELIGPSKIFCSLFMPFIVYPLFRIVRKKNIEDLSWAEVIQSGVVIAVCSPLNRLIYESYIKYNPVSVIIFLLQIFSVICTILIIYLQLGIHERQLLNSEIQLREQIWNLEKKHYEQKKEHIDYINRKCHDLKYQISALKNISDKSVLDENIYALENVVNIYDASPHIGNAALETILAEKELQFRNENIIFKCMAGRDVLKFMDTVDLYILMGNALDNAFESVRDEKEAQRRVIELRIYHDKNFTRIIMTNYFHGEMTFENGLPISRKENKEFHGIGLKSMRQIVQKYDGDLVAELEGPLFVLKIMMPFI